MQTHTVTITGYSSNGDGVARLNDGRVVFIRSAARGDVLEIKLTDVKTKVAQGEIVSIITLSPYRTEPDCPVYPECGGCDFRHITYEEELQAKLNRVNDALERIGGLTIRAREILSTGQTDGYRNKVVLHSDGVSSGFFKAKSHKVVPVDHCLLLKDDLNAAIRSEMGSNAPGRAAWSGEKTFRSGRNGMSPPLEEELDGLIFRVSGFFQVNTGAALLLYNKAREYAAMKRDETLVDLYCGVGSLTLFVGRDARCALGVELNSSSIEAAKENAERNGLSHISFICADAARYDTSHCVAAHLRPDCLIIDPPRSGLSPGVVSKILGLSPKRIVYISCDPATLARDIKLLTGYAATEICAVDMFPRTANVECCCLLTRKG